MTQEEKELLLKDLCARLPYGVKVSIKNINSDTAPWYGTLSCKDLDCFIHDVAYEYIKPYLRPMSSMTEEEVDEIRLLLNNSNCGRVINDENFMAEDFGVLWFTNMRASECVGHTMMCIVIDWLNAHHFDYRGLIEKGLAIEAPEGMYKKGE